jgi:peroxiredoxin-like protein
MNTTHDYIIDASWTGGRAGQGETHAKHVSTLVSLPAEIGGAAIGLNPEEMLGQTAGACFLITLAIVLEKRGVPFEKLAVRSTVTFDAERLKVTRIAHAPVVTFGAAATAEQRAGLADAFHRAEQFCVISNAIRNNVEVTVSQ